VIVYETDSRKVAVSAFNPMAALEVLESEELAKISKEVSEKLQRVIDKVGKGKQQKDV